MTDTNFNPLPLLEEETLAELHEIMGDQFASLVEHFLNDLPPRLEQLRVAIARGSADELHRAAHRFKSSCGSMGATRLMDLVERLEEIGRQNTLAGAEALYPRIQGVAAETATELRARLHEQI